MSNALAIATVSGVLAARVQTLLIEAGLTGLEVSPRHPTDASGPGVYLQLYHVLPNADLRNQSLPERRSDGSGIRAPRLAVDLFYLLSFVGEENTFDSERLAGIVLTGLNHTPRFTGEEISDYLAAPTTPVVLAGSDLPDQAEGVRITPLSLDVEELSRIWGMFGQSMHRLSVAYRVSVVMLEAEFEHGTALPVTTPEVTVFPLTAPRLTGVVSSARDVALVRFGEELVLRGRSLRGSSTLLRFGALVLPVTNPGNEEIRLTFDAASGLGVGISPVQVVHEVLLEDGTAREGAASNVLPVALMPTVEPAPLDPLDPATAVDPVAGGFEVRLAVEPLPDEDQEVELLLVGTGGEGRSAWSEWRVDAAGVAIFTTGVLAAGEYLVRLRIDGAETLLESDPATGIFNAPVVIVA